MKIAVSFSGGRTSAYMSYMIKQNYDCELKFIFMNTGQEHEKTLEFVDRCDKEWDLSVVWLEAVVQKGRVGTSFKIVDFESASRNGEPFEEVIAKYGIPNQIMPHCTRETKLSPFNKYIKSIGWDDCLTAIGIRMDEIDRMQADAKEKGLIYPLVSEFPADKATVNRFWDAQNFDLGLSPLYGNCVFCWKKTTRKHLTIIKESPEYYDFPRRMEQKYAKVGAAAKRTGEDQVFFRGKLSTEDLFTMAEQPFEPWHEDYQYDLFNEFDQAGGCVEGCEVVF